MQRRPAGELTFVNDWFWPNSASQLASARFDPRGVQLSIDPNLLRMLQEARAHRVLERARNLDGQVDQFQIGRAHV